MNRTGLPRRGSATAPRRTGRQETPVQSITGAAEPLTDDIARRTHRYLVQMTIRVVCFVGAVAVDHWTRWVLLVGAVVLPYVAVLLANAGRERTQGPDPYLAQAALPAAPPADRLPGGPSGGTP
ncbi:DUF3099 domain-containing protein [Actinotalea ferrariae]|uniref:DUF3099 domain-containing protein n=1 Tax=Actinotalea ferrariae TaxID=1386098 RepID=UPI001C8C752F|nr:DUF3099 domain-containing protein [Actinotalea ferrariae]MBX9244484.1 DUF3099 domain-containing protein [Actinotalea ferrariae]